MPFLTFKIDEITGQDSLEYELWSENRSIATMKRLANGRWIQVRAPHLLLSSDTSWDVVAEPREHRRPILKLSPPQGAHLLLTFTPSSVDQGKNIKSSNFFTIFVGRVPQHREHRTEHSRMKVHDEVHQEPNPSPNPNLEHIPNSNLKRHPNLNFNPSPTSQTITGT